MKFKTLDYSTAGSFLSRKLSFYLLEAYVDFDLDTYFTETRKGLPYLILGDKITFVLVFLIPVMIINCVTITKPLKYKMQSEKEII